MFFNSFIYCYENFFPEHAIQDFENPIKNAINDILKPSSKYGKTLPVISDSSEFSTFETVTAPVEQIKAIKCFKLQEIIKNRKHLAALIIVLIILMMTAILLLFGHYNRNVDKIPESNVEDIPGVKTIQANSLETPVIKKRLESITQLQTIARDSWKSMKNKVGKRKQLIPIQRVIIMETGADSCTTLEGCKQFLQHKQNKDYPKADDIKENFFVGLDGTIYEGRGWSREGQHSYGK